MAVKQHPDESVVVKYTSHHNHETGQGNVRYQAMPSSIRLSIIRHLNNGCSVRETVRRVRGLAYHRSNRQTITNVHAEQKFSDIDSEQKPVRGGSYEQLWVSRLTVKDVRSIFQTEILPLRRRHKNEGEAVKRQVRELLLEPKSPILAWKQAGDNHWYRGYGVEDRASRLRPISDESITSEMRAVPVSSYILLIATCEMMQTLNKFSSGGVIIDSTHRVSLYDLKLLSFLVKDKDGRGVVSLFSLISNEDSTTMAATLSVLKNYTGFEAPPTVSTDYTSVGIKPWHDVFGTDQIYRLLCYFHLLKGWNAKVKELAVRKQGEYPAERKIRIQSIMAQLKHILYETDAATFEIKLTAMLAELTDHGEIEIAKYLEKNYADCQDTKEMWALCYRTRHTGFSEFSDNTTNAIESFHNVFKKEYLGRKSKRVDDVIEELLRYEEVPVPMPAG